MAFAFEDLQVYHRALDFAVNVIAVIDEIDAPRKHYKLIEQIEASSTSVALTFQKARVGIQKRVQAIFIYLKRILI